VVKNHDAGLIINHMRGRPETWAKLPPLPDVMLSITKDLDASVNRARRNGVDRARMMVDPGIGFGKRKEQNAEILARLREMETLDLPILVGPSRKSFLAQEKPEDTRIATAAAVTAAILNGAHMIRVHDVAEMRMVAMLCDEVLKSARVEEPEEKPRTRTIRARPDSESQPERAKLSPPMKMREVPAAEPAAEAEAPPERPMRPPFRKAPEETERRPYRRTSGPPADRKPPYRRSPAD
ncbi:MAG TPA: hypothetical protein DEQ47_05700, partial [Solibacterales bacterium]|nr:hypothetical protein [Bryobacterales bacterium]